MVACESQLQRSLMPHSKPFAPADFLPKTSRAAMIAALQKPVMASAFNPTAVNLILSVRLLASCAAARRDALAELTTRLGSVAAAKAALDFAQACSLAWPERAMVGRPCCPGLTPDETAFAQMAERAMAADRVGFAGVLDGLVRRERHERLFDVTQQAVAELSCVP